jgi:hypothetical protein
MRYQFGDVVLVPLPFTDQSNSAVFVLELGDDNVREIPAYSYR